MGVSEEKSPHPARGPTSPGALGEVTKRGHAASFTDS